MRLLLYYMANYTELINNPSSDQIFRGLTTLIIRLNYHILLISNDKSSMSLRIWLTDRTNPSLLNTYILYTNVRRQTPQKIKHLLYTNLPIERLISILCKTFSSSTHDEDHLPIPMWLRLLSIFRPVSLTNSLKFVIYSNDISSFNLTICCSCKFATLLRIPEWLALKEKPITLECEKAKQIFRNNRSIASLKIEFNVLGRERTSYSSNNTNIIELLIHY
jgi:hypothetical protein